MKRAQAAIACLLLPALIAVGQADVDARQPAGATEPELVVRVGTLGVSLEGDISSTAHADILRQALAKQFPGRGADVRLRVRQALPPGWALVTELTLRALEPAASATARVAPGRLQIHGLTGRHEQWLRARATLEAHLLPGMALETAMEPVAPGKPMAQQCRGLLRAALRGRSVAFGRDSTRLSTGAAPLLDEVVQIAADCPDGILVVTGHTDRAGNEATNLALSKARADVTAAYLRSRGLAPSRIEAVGAGSSSPRVDHQTPDAGRVNRRVDIDMLFPEPASQSGDDPSAVPP